MDTLVISAGIEHCGSASLWYTLYENNIVHTGHFKQSKYLRALEKADNSIRSVFNQKSKMPFQPNRMNRDPGKWTQEERDDFFYEDFHIDRYIEYYKRVKEKTGFPMVGDFCNLNCDLTEDFIQEISPKLNSAFDVKVLLLLRDPIRRWWHHSHCQGRGYEESYFKGELSDNCFYAEIYRKWRASFPDIHVVIMEDFFSGHTDELSDFLDYPIKTIHRNALMEPIIPHYPELRCQWRSSARPIVFKDLTPELVEYGKEAFEWIYQDCQEEGIYPKYSSNSWYM